MSCLWSFVYWFQNLPAAHCYTILEMSLSHCWGRILTNSLFCQINLNLITLEGFQAFMGCFRSCQRFNFDYEGGKYFYTALYIPQVLNIAHLLITYHREDFNSEKLKKFGKYLRRKSFLCSSVSSSNTSQNIFMVEWRTCSNS